MLTERWLDFSPKVAETLGLGEALLLSCCITAQRFGTGSETCLAESTLARLLPFWQPETWARLFKQLGDVGVLSVLAQPDVDDADADACWRLRLHADGLWAAPAPPGAATAAVMPCANPLSTSLAEAVGLEGAVLISFLDTARSYQADARLGAVRVTDATLRAFLPFWDLETFRVVVDDLVETGVVCAWPADGADDAAGAGGLLLAFAEDLAASESPRFVEPVAKGREATILPDDWQAAQATLDALLDCGVEQQFIACQQREFVVYWRERGEARSEWNTRFFNRALKQWRRETEQRRRAGSDGAMDSYGRLADRSWDS